ncbi:MAG: DNA/RNA non-specific endonuclease [Flavobacteriales bacterium]
MHIPEKIKRAFRERAASATMTKERNHTFEMLDKGRLQDAEPEPGRMERRCKALLKTDRQMVEAMATGRESIQGATTDFLGVAFLERARLAARAVARVASRDGDGFGSGFMIAPGLFLTNNHVLPDIAAANDALIEFDYELDVNDQPKRITRFALDPKKFFITSAESKFDFTIVAVGDRQGRGPALSAYGHVPLLGTGDKHVLGEWVNIVQHPDADLKQITLRENLLVSRLEHVLHYKADTMPGSSGSPVFNDQWEAIALHHYGEPFRQKGRKGMDLNEGIRVSAIVRALKDETFKPINGSRKLLEPVVNAVRGEMRTDGPVLIEDGGDDRRTVRIGADGTATITLPLEISMKLPQAELRAGSHSNNHVGAGESVTIDDRYNNRKGYDPKFLGGTSIPLPVMTAAMKAKAAKLLSPGAGNSPHELKYEHFSLVMSAQRRMAFFTAANINGTSWKQMDRDGNLGGGEATEKWFQDPRIAAEDQCQQPMYDGQPKYPLRFDRGHLIRREYPNWGTATVAKRANADTFHFTNCTPQAAVFNQSAKHWQGIENYVIRNAEEGDENVTVFVGPVFNARDPQWNDVRVPRKFWKILVRKVGGTLRTTGFLADQTEQMDPALDAVKGHESMGAEDFDIMSDSVALRQCRITEIERLTKLKFGTLRDHDTYDGGGEAVRESGTVTRLVRSYREVRL